MRPGRLVRLCLLVGAVSALVPAAAPGALELTPVARLPFPERGYVVGTSDAARLDASRIVVRENGRVVSGVRVSPIVASGLRLGVVLAVDASQSMAGEPYEAAFAAAQAFLEHRRPSEELGFVAFNGEVTVVQAPTRDETLLDAALADPPELAYGTRIYDALDRSLRLLANARVSSGSIVLLSDGDDLGSSRDLDEIVASAQRQRVRIFTVGLRSKVFDDAALRALAEGTGAAYAEAASPSELEQIYESLGERLASEYLVQYRSDARPETTVDVRISADEVGAASVEYVAPTPSGLAPYRQSFVSRFVLAPGSIFALGALVAALLGWTLVVLLRGGPKRDLVQRVTEFSSTPAPAVTQRDLTALRRSPGVHYTRGVWAKLERDLQVARLDLTPRQVAAATIGSSLLLVLLLGLVSPVLAVLGLVAPALVARSLIRLKLGRLRNEFADQLPAALQVLASALRAGHSFTGALGVVVENVREPARSELRRVAQDDRLGVNLELAIRRVAKRMANRDLEQVALLAELQRTAGGNSAEVLDTVVETIRQRSELRRLVRTLTAQGRMARWILTALPVFLAVFLWFMQPEIMGSFFGSAGGQVALLVAIVMVAAGSIAIQRIVDIDV